MTRDDIIRMAREAGSIDSEDVIETVFAAFAAAERESCIALCKQHAEEYRSNYQLVAGMACMILAKAIEKRGEK